MSESSDHLTEQTDSPTEQDSPWPYEVRVTEDGRGIGCFATRAIAPGEIVLYDRALILWDDGMRLIEKLDVIIHAYHTANSRTREDWLSLSSEQTYLRSFYAFVLRLQGDEHTPLFASEPMVNYPEICMLVQCNSFGILTSHAGFYLRAARFNHSCDPNVTWHQATGSDDWIGRATRRVEAGEELVVSYINVANVKPERQLMLTSGWGFNCRCPKCTGGPDLYTSRLRQELNVLTGQGTAPVVIDFPNDETMDMAVDRMNTRFTLLKRIMTRSPRPAGAAPGPAEVEMIFTMWDKFNVDREEAYTQFLANTSMHRPRAHGNWAYITIYSQLYSRRLARASAAILGREHDGKRQMAFISSTPFSMSY
ncbi:hypothetical protein GGR50DRAFT_53778 [Xylaria sp. CBS 124048]|nr:hypothetical protein GGR50DRAFT_53778 [Xylaria sp. CBS 124048]